MSTDSSSAVAVSAVTPPWRVRSSAMAIRSMPASVRTSAWSSEDSAMNSAWEFFGGALAVIARDLRDELDLTVGEPGELIAVADDVVRVLVVRGVGDEESDVVEQGCGLEQVACREVEAVDLLEGVEERQRQIGGGLDVGDVLVEDLGHPEHRLAADVAEMAERRLTVAHRHVEQDTLAERRLGHRHRLDGEPVEDLLEQEGAGDDDVDPLVLEAVEAAPVVGVGAGQDVVDHRCGLVARERDAIGGGTRVAAPTGDGHGTEGVDGARRPDGEERPVLTHTADRRHEQRTYMGATVADGTRVSPCPRGRTGR